MLGVLCVISTRTQWVTVVVLTLSLLLVIQGHLPSCQVGTVLPIA